MNIQMKEMCRVRYMRRGISFCAPPGMPLTQYIHIITNLEVLQILYFWDFTVASSRRHDQLLTPFLPLLLSPEKGDGDENFKLLIMDFFSGEPPPSRSHPELSH